MNDDQFKFMHEQYSQLLSAFNRIWLMLLLLSVMGAINITLLVMK